MTTTEIRDLQSHIDRAHPNGYLAIAQLEVAAQLSELNSKIDLFTVNQSPDFKSFAVTLCEEEDPERVP